MNSERLRICERLNGDVEFRMRTKVTASMSEVWTFQKRGIWKGFLMAFKAVAL